MVVGGVGDVGVEVGLFVEEFVEELVYYCDEGGENDEYVIDVDGEFEVVSCVEVDCVEDVFVWVFGVYVEFVVNFFFLWY